MVSTFSGGHLGSEIRECDSPQAGGRKSVSGGPGGGGRPPSDVHQSLGTGSKPTIEVFRQLAEALDTTMAGLMGEVEGTGK
jgi:hypothetical protein